MGVATVQHWHLLKMDVCEVVYPFYIVSKLLGYTYFYLPRKDADGHRWWCWSAAAKKFEIVKGDIGSGGGGRKIFVQLTVALVYLVIVCCNVLLNVQHIIFSNVFVKDAFSTVTGQMLSSSLFTCTGVMNILSMIHSWYFRREVRLILDKFRQFDAIFQKHFAPVNHVHHRQVLFRYIVGTTAIVLLLVPGSHIVLGDGEHGPPFSLTFLLFGCVSTLNYAVLQSQTILSVAAVLVRLRSVNRELNGMLGERQQAISWRTAARDVAKVQQCRILHDILNDIVELINLCFTFCAMWCTLACFGFCLMSMYSDYEIMATEKSLKLVYVNFAWNVYYTMFSTSIVWVASRTRTEANRTTALVHKIINASVEPILTDEVDRPMTMRMTRSKSSVYPVPFVGQGTIFRGQVKSGVEKLFRTRFFPAC